MAEAKVTKKKTTTTKVAKKEAKDGTPKKVSTTKSKAVAHEEVADAEVVEKPAKEAKIAKAGKRSEKALKEEAEKGAKEERKAEAKTEEAEKPKSAPAPKARPLIERKGIKFQEVAKLINQEKQYSIPESLELATKTSSVKFDATVELHVRLNVDPRHADQNIRDSLVLPAGTGKTSRIAVFAEADDASKAKAAGADIAGMEEVTKLLDKNQITFDVLIATPMAMAKLGKYARLLGPRGLMPNPKSGTVTPDVVKAVKEAKAGRVEYRVDSTGIVHLGIGKVSFGAGKLGDNAKAVLASIKAAKPASVKGTYYRSAFVSTTMGPSIQIDINNL